MKSLVDLRPADIGSELEAEVIVTEITDVISVITEACFKCNSCGAEQFLIQPNPDSAFVPLECPKDGGCGKRATVTSFQLLTMNSLHVATQLVEVQDIQYQSSRQPVVKKLILEEDLVEQVEPGDVISLKYKPKGKMIGKNTMKYDLILNGISLEHHDKMSSQPNLSDEDLKVLEEITDGDPWETISKSIAPGIVGVDREKRVLALALFSGVGYRNRDHVHVNDSISILWVGDPAIAKSQVLDYCSSVLPRGQFTVGGQATHARLVGTATQGADGKWTIKAGKFALANESIHCIDELGEFEGKTISSLREVMAQQTVHVDKGDKSICMKTNEIIIAAMNPKGDRFKVDSGAPPLISQIDDRKISPALISRFDWLLFGIDIVDVERDKAVAEAIVDKYSNKGARPKISLDLLRKFVLLRRDINPVISSDVKEHIVKEYGEMRQLSMFKFNAGREITARQIETLIKSIRALARIRGHRDVTREDADNIIDLYKSNLSSLTNGSMNIEDIFTASSQDDRTMVEKVFQSICDGGKSQADLDEEMGEDVSKYVEKLSNHERSIFFNNGLWRKA